MSWCRKYGQTSLATTYCAIVLHKLTVTKLVKKFLTHYIKSTFITVSTTAKFQLSQLNPVHDPKTKYLPILDLSTIYLLFRFFLLKFSITFIYYCSHANGHKFTCYAISTTLCPKDNVMPTHSPHLKETYRVLYLFDKRKWRRKIGPLLLPQRYHILLHK